MCRETSGYSRSLDLTSVKGDTSGGDKVRTEWRKNSPPVDWQLLDKDDRQRWAFRIVKSSRTKARSPAQGPLAWCNYCGDATSNRVTVAGPWESALGAQVSPTRLQESSGSTSSWREHKTVPMRLLIGIVHASRRYVNVSSWRDDII